MCGWMPSRARPPLPRDALRAYRSFRCPACQKWESGADEMKGQGQPPLRILRRRRPLRNLEVSSLINRAPARLAREARL